MTAMHSLEPLRVDPTEVREEQSSEDFGGLLNENLALLRRVEQLTSKMEEKDVLIDTLKEQDLTTHKLLSVDAYRLGRRAILGLHVGLSIFSVLMGILGCMVVHGAFALLVLIGIAWFCVISAIISDFADKEKDQDEREKGVRV